MVKCCVVYSKEVSRFGIFNAEFYINSKKEDRKEILSLTDKEVSNQVKFLKDYLLPIEYSNRCFKEVTKELGHEYIGSLSSQFSGRECVILLILKTLCRKLDKYLKDKLLILQKECKLVEKSVFLLKENKLEFEKG